MPVTYLTLKEAARDLGLASSTLRHQIRNGKFVAIKVGTEWYVTPEEVARYGRESRGKGQPNVAA